MNRLCQICLLCLLLGLPLSLPAAAVSGVVTDRTSGQPAAHATVTLVSTAQGLQELAHTATDRHGRFTLNLPSNGTFLLRVERGGVAYYAEVPSGAATVNLNVFEASPEASGVTVEDDIVHIEAKQHALHIAESYFVRNSSSPPRTCFSQQGFAVALPQGAQVSAAFGTDPAGVTQTLSPVRGRQPGRYLLRYALRPGETQLEIDYSIPWNGSFTFHNQALLPTDHLAVMLPASMTFSSPSFRSIPQSPDYQTFLAKSFGPRTPVSFTVSGTGSFPASGQNAQSGQDSNGTDSPDQTANAPGGGLGAPIGSPDPLTRYKWMFLSALFLVLAVAAAFLLRPKPAQASAHHTDPAPEDAAAPAPLPAAAAAQAFSPLPQALRQELFLAETDRRDGKLSESEYSEVKAALDTLLRRSLREQTEHSELAGTPQ